MSADSTTNSLVRFDTRERPVYNQQESHQTDLRATNIREHGQLAFDELTTPQDAQASQEGNSVSDRSSRSDFEAERDRLKRETDSEGER
jgi:hypothetical protein